MEHFDVLSNDSIIEIVFSAMGLCGILATIFLYIGQRDAVNNYKKGMIRKVVPWVLLCVLLSNIVKLGYLLYQYPWSVNPQPSQASMLRQIRSMCEYPIWGFANDYQMPILTNLAGVVFWVCWTAYAFSFRPSATSWWKKACKVIAYFLLSAIILGFYVHELKDFLFYGVILLMVFILLKFAHVKTVKKRDVQLSSNAHDDDANKVAPKSDEEESHKESQNRVMPPALTQKEKTGEVKSSNNSQNNKDKISTDNMKIIKEENKSKDAMSESICNTKIINSKADDETIMYCKYCGQQIKSDSIYCSHCGKKII